MSAPRTSPPRQVGAAALARPAQKRGASPDPTQSGSEPNFPFFAVALGLAAFGLGFAAQAQESPRGRDIFDSACAHCHGANGQGTTLGPSILARVAETDEDDELAAFLRAGVPQRGMPPAPVTGDEMNALVGYLRFLGSAAGAADVAAASEDGVRAARSTIASFRPVTEEVLQAPDDADWLWLGRSREGRRYSPLDQVNAGNVHDLRLVWSRGLPAGSLDAMPIVYSGVMYVAMPDSSIAALDAATGDVFWQHHADDATAVRSESRSGVLSIFGDTLYFTPMGGTPVALDARTGEPRAAARGAAASVPRPSNDAAPASSAPLATAGGLIFRGDGERRYRALDAATGDVLWQAILGGPISAGGVSYAVDARQHIAVIVGTAPAGAPLTSGDSSASPGALYVFALPDVGEQDDR